MQGQAISRAESELREREALKRKRIDCRIQGIRVPARYGPYKRQMRNGLGLMQRLHESIHRSPGLIPQNSVCFARLFTEN